jgi:hypothetical protein
LPEKFPAGSPVEVLFHYQPNGRLKVRVNVTDAERQMTTEIVRENSLAKEQLDEWRKLICGLEPTNYR